MDVQSVFDVFMIVLGISNALHQPYTQNVEVIMRFRRDGAIFFIVRPSHISSSSCQGLTTSRAGGLWCVYARECTERG